MNINFYDIENHPLYYSVTAEECACFTQADVNTEVGFLPVHTIYEIVDFIDDENDNLNWVKIKKYDDEYYALVLPDKCVIKELPVVKEEHKQGNFIKNIISKIKSIFTKK